MQRPSSLIPLACLLPLLCLPSSAGAQGPQTPLTARRYHPPDWPPNSLLAASSSGGQCEGGISYDDGSVEGALAFTADTLDMVQLFDFGTSGATINDVCVCWTRDAQFGPSTDLPFEVVFYDVAGNGEPGDLITAVPHTATNIPQFMSSQFYTVDLSGDNVVIPGQQAYVGVSWFANAEPEFFLCTDDNSNANQPLFASADLGVSWSAIRDIPPPPGEPADSLSRIDALMVRAQTEENRVEPFTCVEDDTTLCLVDDGGTGDGRFQVKVDWRSSNGGQGVGMAHELTSDTGYFWFFDPNNVEMVIKVLNSCVLPENIGGNHFWVFAGGLTNVEVNITVTDSETGVFKTYTNPINTAFQPIQDTGAFETCP